MPAAVYNLAKQEQEVRDLVDQERSYQNQMLGGRSKGRPTIFGNILLLDNYIAKAFEAWAEHSDEDAALSEVRKITAIAIRCMEDNGGMDGMGMTRSDVYTVALGERSLPFPQVIDLAEALVRLRSLVREAEDVARRAELGRMPMGSVKEIIAYGVATMEIHGAPARQMEPRRNGK